MCVNENLVRMNICGLVSERFPLKMSPVVEGLPNGVKFFLLVLVMNQMIITIKLVERVKCTKYDIRHR